MRTIRSQKGFTLVEFLIYSVITTFLVGSLILVGSNILQGRAKVGIVEEVSHNGRKAIERITYDIRQAESIISPIIGSEGSLLSLEMPIKENSPTEFYVDVNGVLAMRMGELGDRVMFLTSEDVIIDNLKFTNASYTTSTPGTVRIETTKPPIPPRVWDFTGI